MNSETAPGSPTRTVRLTSPPERVRRRRGRVGERAVVVRGDRHDVPATDRRRAHCRRVGLRVTEVGRGLRAGGPLNVYESRSRLETRRERQRRAATWRTDRAADVERGPARPARLAERVAAVAGEDHLVGRLRRIRARSSRHRSRHGRRRGRAARSDTDQLPSAAVVVEARATAIGVPLGAGAQQRDPDADPAPRPAVDVAGDDRVELPEVDLRQRQLVGGRRSSPARSPGCRRSRGSPTCPGAGTGGR